MTRVRLAGPGGFVGVTFQLGQRTLSGTLRLGLPWSRSSLQLAQRYVATIFGPVRVEGFAKRMATARAVVWHVADVRAEGTRGSPHCHRASFGK